VTTDNLLEEMTLRQLRRVASACGVSRYSRMRKSQLLEEIQKIQSTQSTHTPSTQLEAQLAVGFTQWLRRKSDRFTSSRSSMGLCLLGYPDRT
jgi:uncharacterized protein